MEDPSQASAPRRPALSPLQLQDILGPGSEVSRKSRPSSRMSVSSASSALLDSLQEELAETERLMAATRRQQCEADAALQGAVGERHALGQQLLQHARAASRRQKPPPAANPDPPPASQSDQGRTRANGVEAAGAEAAAAAEGAGAERVDGMAAPSTNDYESLLARYQVECELRQAAQQLLAEVQDGYNAAVEALGDERAQRTAVLESLQGIQARYASAVEAAGFWATSELLDAPHALGAAALGASALENGAATRSEEGRGEKEAGEEGGPPTWEELQAAYLEARAANEALQSEVQRALVERNAALDRLEVVEQSLSDLHLHHQQEQQQQDEASSGTASIGFAPAAAPGSQGSSRSSERRSSGTSPAASAAGSRVTTPRHALGRSGSATPDLSPTASRALRPLALGTAAQAERTQDQSMAVPRRLSSGAWGEAGRAAAPGGAMHPTFLQLEGALRRLGELAEEVERQQQAAGAPGPASPRGQPSAGSGVLGALRRHVGELQARSAVVYEELAAAQAVVEELQGRLGEERRGRTQLEARLATAQRDSRLAERERTEMQQHIQELQDLVEAAIDEAEGSRLLLQKVTAEEGSGQKLKLGELWTKLMEAEQRAMSALRPKSAAASADGAAGAPHQQQRLYEVWGMLEASRQGSEDIGDDADPDSWRRRAALRSAQSLRSRLAALNSKFGHANPARQPPPRSPSAKHPAPAAERAEQQHGQQQQQGEEGGVGAWVAAEDSASSTALSPRGASRHVPRWGGRAGTGASSDASPFGAAAAPGGWPSLLSPAGSEGSSSLQELDVAQRFSAVVTRLQQRLERGPSAEGRSVLSAAATAAAGPLPAGEQPDRDSLEGFSPHVQELLRRVLDSPPPAASPTTTCASTATSAPPDISAAAAAAAAAALLLATPGSAGAGAAQRGGTPVARPKPGSPVLPTRLSPAALRRKGATASASKGPAALAAEAATSHKALPEGWVQAQELPYFRRDAGLPQPDTGAALTARHWWVYWLVPPPLRLLCANLTLWALGPLNLALFNRVSAAAVAGGTGLVGLALWLALAPQVPRRRAPRAGSAR